MSTARRVLIWIGAVALVLLNWAALADITTGEEPNLMLEYSVVGASILLVLAWLFRSWRRKSSGKADLGLG